MAIIGILGSTGMAGSLIYTYLKDRGHIVLGYSRSKVEGFSDEPLNLHNSTHLENLYMWIKAQQPDAVINCTGVLVKDSNENPSEAIYVNSYFPHLLESWCEKTRTKVIHLSTDCIFDGEEFAYYEDTLPTERNLYGRSKALGEIDNGKDITLRQSIIGPAPQSTNTGLLNWILTQKEPEVQGFNHVEWNGITTLELAKHIENILVNHPHLSGIYHLVPDDELINKYELLKLIKKIWNLDVTIEKNKTQSSHKILTNTRDDYHVNVPGYEKQLTELKEYMDKHNIGVGSYY